MKTKELQRLITEAVIKVLNETTITQDVVEDAMMELQDEYSDEYPPNSAIITYLKKNGFSSLSSSDVINIKRFREKIIDGIEGSTGYGFAQ